jgi:hypothetical protein
MEFLCIHYRPALPTEVWPQVPILGWSYSQSIGSRDLRPSAFPTCGIRDVSRLFDACYSLQMNVMERVWGVGDESPLIDSAMVPLMNHAEKPIALALLREAWPDGSGEVAGPPFAWDPMPLDDMRRLARRLGTLFDLGPTVETLDQVSTVLPTDR